MYCIIHIACCWVNTKFGLSGEWRVIRITRVSVWGAFSMLLLAVLETIIAAKQKTHTLLDSHTVGFPFIHVLLFHIVCPYCFFVLWNQTASSLNHCTVHLLYLSYLFVDIFIMRSIANFLVTLLHTFCIQIDAEFHFTPRHCSALFTRPIPNHNVLFFHSVLISVMLG